MTAESQGADERSEAPKRIEHLSFAADAGGAALAHLCGPLDENLRQMEAILNVSISRRGSQFRVAGEPREARRCVRALEVLLDRVNRTGAELTVDDVQWHFVGGDDEYRREQAESGEMGANDVELKTRRRDLRGRTPNQRAYLQAILSHDINFGIGPAGTGKTYLAVAAAVDAFERGTVERIVLTRPAVEAGERLGFLPGDLSQKVDPYLRPLYDALFDLMGFDKVQRLMERQSIEVAPLAYMRGRTLNNAFVILDEAQNTTGEQMKMFLTRIGFGSKAVITGDVTQIDLPKGVLSGLKQASRVLEGVRGISFTRFRSSDVVRHPLVARIVEAYEAAAAADEAAKKAEREARRHEVNHEEEKHHA
ncbi:PhoH family protein [uncultured Sutterella sp.]|uniref:PhoH family protein n=1 Tax=uncultured Sutterella sp. TaxID=286133 RepID=UPI0025FA2E4D|nr:PhoH family protein [uncultured Sutterella sp.]